MKPDEQHRKTHETHGKNLGKTKGAVAGIPGIRNHDGAAHGEPSKILWFPEIIKKQWKINVSGCYHVMF